MFAELTIGDSINARGPKGQFNYTPNMCREIGMIAGGTGLTPMLQVIIASISSVSLAQDILSCIFWRTSAHRIFINISCCGHFIVVFFFQTTARVGLEYIQLVQRQRKPEPFNANCSG